MSGNPYYIQPQQPQFLNFANSLIHMKLAREDQALRERTLKQQGDNFNIQHYGTVTPQPGAQTIQAQQLDIQRRQADTAAAQVPHHKRNFGTVTAKMGQNTLTKLGVKKENPLFTTLEEMANNPAIDNEQAYLRVKNDYPAYYQTLKNEIADDYVKKFEKDENYANTPEGKKQLQVLDALDKDQTGDTVLGGFFPATVQSMEMEQRKLRAAQTPVAVVGEDGKPRYMSAEEAMRTGAERFTPNTEKKSVSNIQAEVLRKWMEGEKLTPAEEKIRDKYFRGDKDTYGDARMRYKAKVDEFESTIGRKATVDEKRRLFIQDPYGILAPPGEGQTPDAPTPDIPSGAPTATGKNGEKIYWDGKNWIDVKTKKAVK